MAKTKLIIGLGNPGAEYDHTRHNVGFMILDKLAKLAEVDFEFDKKINAEIAKGKIEKTTVILARPFTFVNKSGEAARKLKLKNKSKLEDIIIVHDDLDIEFGRFKLSYQKDSGGHRGVQSIIDAFKSNKFWRLRIGTSNRKLATARDQNTLKAKREAVGDFVLAKFSPAEYDTLKKTLKEAIERLLTVL